MSGHEAKDTRSLTRLARGYAEGDDSVGDALCRQLSPRLYKAAAKFLASPDDRSDLVQETLVSVLAYLRRTRGFEGDVGKFAVSVACNRCRDLLRWRQRRPEQRGESLLAWTEDPARSPLDILADAEVVDLLHRGLAKLSAGCRELLTGLYLGEATVEEFRRRAGLGSVQAVYYRRMICLRELADFLQNRLRIRYPSRVERSDDDGRSRS